MRHGCPTGVANSIIRPCGIFPSVDGSSAAVENSKAFAKLAEGRVWHQDGHRNYASFYEGDGTLAAEEIERLQQKGSIEIFGSWSEIIT
eukprot:609698-Karenia_brevis.AAC.1